MDDQPPDAILPSPHETVKVGCHWAVCLDWAEISSTAFLNITDLWWSLHAPVGLGFRMLAVSRCHDISPQQLVHVFWNQCRNYHKHMPPRVSDTSFVVFRMSRVTVNGLCHVQCGMILLYPGIRNSNINISFDLRLWFHTISHDYLPVLSDLV